MVVNETGSMMWGSQYLRYSLCSSLIPWCAAQSESFVAGDWRGFAVENGQSDRERYPIRGDDRVLCGFYEPGRKEQCRRQLAFLYCC